MNNDLTPYAEAGFSGADNVHIATSPVWYAHELGRQLGTNAREKPAGVRMGRGDSIWSNGVRWKFTHRAGGKVRFEAQQ